MKMLGKTWKGKEYLISRKDSFIVSPSKAQIACNALNNLKYRLESSDEYWKVYNVKSDDIEYMNAGTERLVVFKNKIVIRQY